ELQELDVLINKFLISFQIFFIDNYHDLMNYIHDKDFPFIEEILDDTQDIKLIQEQNNNAIENESDNEEQLPSKVLPKDALNIIQK
ncbi:3374_t:CDS:1, partial [Funneliformis geosporum]